MGFIPDIRVFDHTPDFLRVGPLVHRAIPILQELRKVVRERVDLALVDDVRMIHVVWLQT